MNGLKPAELWLQTFLREHDSISIADLLKAARAFDALEDDVVAVLLSHGFRTREGKWLIWPEHWQ